MLDFFHGNGTAPMGGPKVFVVDLAGIDTPPPVWREALDAAEWERACRFRQPADRLAFVAAHALKRLALAAERPGDRPADLRFAVNAFGKPALAEVGSVHFNLSHTAGLVAVALWRSGPVGLDVETMDGGIADADLARATFTADEVAGLDSEPDWTRAFFALWTAKEAVIKAEGQGLSLPLSVVTIGEAEACGPSGRWRLWRAEPRPRHLLALAWAGENGQDPVIRLLAAADLTAWAGEGSPPVMERSDCHA